MTRKQFMSEMEPAGEKQNWERQVIEKLARSALDEQRKSRNWGIFFKALTFLYLFALLFMAFGWLGGREPLQGDHTALVELNGVIAADTHANADVISQGLQDAFENKGTKGVILRINSPGGSPVQAGTINSEKHKLRRKNPQIPPYPLAQDISPPPRFYAPLAPDPTHLHPPPPPAP